MERNTTQVQLMGDLISSKVRTFPPLTSSDLETALQTIKPVIGSELFLIDDQGKLNIGSDDGSNTLPLRANDLTLLIQTGKPNSLLLESMVTKDQVVASFSPVNGSDLGVVLTEPWISVMALASNFQIVLIILLIIGVALSLIMLSISISRVIHPLSTLSEHAASAIPGSIFHPVPMKGPLEIKALIQAFNQMVIRLAEQQASLRQYAHTALLSQEEERQRLSHELHDGTLQDLVGLIQRVQLCSEEMKNNPDVAQERLDEIQKLLQQTLEDVRRISTALRPPILEDFGLPVALDALCKTLRKDKPSIHCVYKVLGKSRRLDADLELAVYRVVQEALTNVRKHAENATQVSVSIEFADSTLKTIVKNNGAYFANRNIHSLVQSGHLGLAGMYERANLFGGTLKIKSTQGKLTIIVLEMPYSQEINGIN